MRELIYPLASQSASASASRVPGSSTRSKRKDNKASSSSRRPSADPVSVLVRTGNNVIYDQPELLQRQLAAHDACIGLAERATFILNSQATADTLDLRPFATDLDDVLLNELAKQLRANLKFKAKQSLGEGSHLKAEGTNFSSVVLSSCERITPVGMRSFIHVMGSVVTRLDYSGSKVSPEVLKVMATAIDRLDTIDFSACPTLTTDSIRSFISCCNRSLTSLNISRCQSLNDDAVGWIAGTLGPQGSLTQCTRLLSIDLSHTPGIGDRGLGHLAVGCRALQFINFEGMERITAAGIRQVAQGCRNLRVLSLRKCMQLTDPTLMHLGRHSVNLRSINLSGCYQFTSEGLHALVKGTPHLQSLNLEGCRYMREDILAIVATTCVSLCVLNVDGCQEITDNGLATLAEHLPFVTLAQRYRGLAPAPDSTQIKFSIQLRTIQHSAAIRIQSVVRGVRGRAVASAWRREMVELPAMRRICRQYRNYRLRHEIAHRVERTSLQRRSAIQIQSRCRGMLCRMTLMHDARERQRLSAWGVSAVIVQAAYRGHWTRKNRSVVFKTLQRYRRERALLERESAVVLLQRAFRARFNRSRLDDIMAIQRQRRRERHEAAVVLQRLFRSRAARRGYQQLKDAIKQQQEQMREMVRYATRLQSQWRGLCGRRAAVRAQAEWQQREQRRQHAASRINAGVRGYFARKMAHSLRMARQTQRHSAWVIQRAWRHYKDASVAERLKFDRMLSSLRQQAKEESLAAKQQQETWLRNAKEQFNRDSASEPESDDDWHDVVDDAGFPFWFSPSRDERQYVRPNEYAREKCVLGTPCRVFWPLEEKWFTGRITRFHRGKRKHRVDYDDGEHEWVKLGLVTSGSEGHDGHAAVRRDPLDGDRVQLFNGYSWCMAHTLEPSMRALKAAVFLTQRVQYYDQRSRSWRFGTILAYSEPADSFLVAFDHGESTSEEWVALFQQEQAVQMQDAASRQWVSMSSYVFGVGQGRPVGILKASEMSRYYGIEDYLCYVENAGGDDELPYEHSTELHLEGGDPGAEVAAEQQTGDLDSGEDADADSDGESDEDQDEEQDEEDDATSESQDGGDGQDGEAAVDSSDTQSRGEGDDDDDDENKEAGAT